ncbi:EAL domain-containing protein [Pseudoalteromonas sp. MMG013]|uniref:putative bifunctional diguanylate cyclase/phosphodiesterase n=1 Tax=Pseudoalteromonas sp. MMG013 TaxID=2822687 RepID=UPI001B38290A|nr:bifunctional diguanylate cyclase/phosphodiesterase [Pseudoalteromonas sp. MMG013]MBQ4861899.1 EAL domain-containing protein [Pseudoalteromonas sp. MMG013]
MHHLLARLLKKSGFSGIDSPQYARLIGLLSEAFEHADEDRWMLEHSLNLTSKELTENNLELRTRLVDIDKYQRSLELALTRQKAILDASPEVVVEFNISGEITHINQNGCKFIGCDEHTALALDATQVLHTILSLLTSPDIFIEQIQAMFVSKKAQLTGNFETIHGQFYEYYSVPELIQGEYIGRVWCCRDISDLRAQKVLLSQQANRDSLTGLANRFNIIETVNRMIKKENPQPFALVLIDLDDFKKINDSLGHLAGDDALKISAKRLERRVVKPDLLARLGGDEFLVVLTTQDLQEIHLRLAHILSAFHDPIKIEGNCYQLSLSVGVATYPAHGDQVSEILGKADIAMYQAKKQGKNQYKLFDAALEERVQKAIYIEERLRQAILLKQFELYFQPKIDISSREVVSLEALIRWNVNGHMIFPDEFIPIAEDKGLIGKITDCVLEMACETLSQWHGLAHLKNLSIAINISGKDISVDNFFEKLAGLLKRYKFEPSLLELELTESALISNLANVKDTLMHLKNLGIKVAIDDFGTGYSSLAYLQALDIHYLKIDRQFVAALLTEPKAEAIVQSIIDVGKNLGLGLIAEGVEQAEHLARLDAMGCDQAQGYYICRPLPLSELIKFISGQRKCT